MEEKIQMEIKFVENIVKLKINPNEKLLYEKAANLAKETYEKYSKTLQGKSFDYLLLLALLDLSKEYIQLKNQSQDSLVLLELSDINQEINEYLKNS